MAAKGNIAKEKVLEKIAQSFGSDWIGIYDKKAYLWGEENGEKIQIALTLTCPKTPVGQTASKLDFENMGSISAAPTTFEPAQITDQERENINRLMKELGL